MVRLLAQVDKTRRDILHSRLRASNTASSPALARLRNSPEDNEEPLHVWALDNTPKTTPSDDVAFTAMRDGNSEPGPPLPSIIEPNAQTNAAPPGSREEKALSGADANATPTASPSKSATARAAMRKSPTATIPVAALDSDIIGGFVGHTWARWLHLTYLFVSPSARRSGLGSTLLAEAERLAQNRGCIGAIVQTWDFQAPSFYEKNGYEIVGKVVDYPPGITDYTLVKRFKPSAQDVVLDAVRAGVSET